MDREEMLKRARAKVERLTDQELWAFVADTKPEPASGYPHGLPADMVYKLD